MLGGYDYELRELDPSELEDFMRRREFRGINVTIPYKRAVMPYLDEVSGQARAIGAVNTVVNRDGRLFGYNTDFGGVCALIRRIGIEPGGKKALILGTGATSRTACAAVRDMNASEIVRVSRSGREGAATYEDLYRLHGDAQIIINTTPCGMFPDIGKTPADIGMFPALEGVADVIYNPVSTRLVLDARERGIPAEGGLYMLVSQAVLAAELFTGKSFAPETVTEVYERLRQRLENPVLIGMPGSGKSAVGRLSAQYLGREFIDLDELIAGRDGRSITDIFAQSGEPYFRELEAKLVKEVAARTGVVIATGGGTVLDPENVRYLRMNGRLIFLDRPPEQLVPTDDRPLADRADKIRKLYSDRYPIYAAAADVTVVPSGTAQETAQRVADAFRKGNTHETARH